MSIGPSGMIGSVAGSPLSQTRGSDSQRAQQESAAKAGQAQAEQGVGETAPDQQSSDRDADGHRLWEQTPESSARPSEDQAGEEELSSRDPTGDRGANLDLSG